MSQRRILLIVGGGIAAYKSLELVRLCAKAGIATRAILTKAGAEFVTPLSLSALTEDKVYQDLFNLTDESEMGHIQLSRSADLVVVSPATADLIAKAANGLASDLASTTILATDKPVLYAPAMNVRMWDHPATQANVTTLKSRGALFVGPNEGAMACGEFGYGRLSEPAEILAVIQKALGAEVQGPLSGKKALVTAGPTVEPLDPVRFISNRSSGKQGYAIARALARLGADVTLVAGPTALPDPQGLRTVHVETAREMLNACQAQSDIDVVICVAAVADWRPADTAAIKIKKGAEGPPPIKLEENPDILATLSKAGKGRAKLVVGFAAETNDVEAHAQAKLAKKGCDWIVANDVGSALGVMGGDENEIVILNKNGAERLPRMDKNAAADALAKRIAAALA
jgi:phosphopantothenoylcysteine decarboxylase/phosphopantothenate--cysteine ligase